MIYKVEQYVDDDGRQVFYKRPTVSDSGIEPVYMGMFTVTVPTQFGPQDAQIQFDFPKDFPLEKCFEKFEELAKEEYDRLIQEIKEKNAESKILTPHQEMGGIIVPK